MWWSVTSRNSNGEIDRIEAPTKATALALARRLYGNRGERDAFGRPTKQAVYVTKYPKFNSSRRKNPTKAQKREKARKVSVQRRVAVALAKFLKQANPAMKTTGATVQHLKGGVIKITPIKANAAGKGKGCAACSQSKAAHKGLRMGHTYIPRPRGKEYGRIQ